jgi:Tfp pilus assembly protein PilZ
VSPRYSYFRGYSIFLFSQEGNEPVRVHVAEKSTPMNSSKFWVRADGIELAHNNARLPAHLLKEIETYLALNADDIIAFWNRHMNK